MDVDRDNSSGLRKRFKNGLHCVRLQCVSGYADPEQLMKNPSGQFHKMMSALGPDQVENLRRKAGTSRSGGKDSSDSSRLRLTQRKRTSAVAVHHAHHARQADILGQRQRHLVNSTEV
jgi:hypothetical protein